MFEGMGRVESALGSDCVARRHLLRHPFRHVRQRKVEVVVRALQLGQTNGELAAWCERRIEHQSRLGPMSVRRFRRRRQLDTRRRAAIALALAGIAARAESNVEPAAEHADWQCGESCFRLRLLLLRQRDRARPAKELRVCDRMHIHIEQHRGRADERAGADGALPRLPVSVVDILIQVRLTQGLHLETVAVGQLRDVRRAEQTTRDIRAGKHKATHAQSQARTELLSASQFSIVSSTDASRPSRYPGSDIGARSSRASEGYMAPPGRSHLSRAYRTDDTIDSRSRK